jgi:putative ABC transport system substrate-binding protein
MASHYLGETMQRRKFIGLVGGAALWPVMAGAQSAPRKPLIGILWHGSAEKEWANPFYRYMHDDFAAQGFVAEKTARFEERYAGEVQEVYDRLATELVGTGPDLLVGPLLPSALALRKATSRIPIVFLGVPDPVASGLVASIARPGGNATGLGNVGLETFVKRVAILRELVPNLSKLALIANLDVPAQAAQEHEFYAAGAAANGLQLEVFSARDKPTIDEAFAKLVQAGCNGVVISSQGMFFLLRDELAQAALAHKLPSMGPSDSFVPSGILVSYSPRIRQRFTDVAALGARILRGENPADIPVQFPTRFEYAVNLKTAAALGLAVPPTVLMSATLAIE